MRLPEFATRFPVMGRAMTALAFRLAAFAIPALIAPALLSPAPAFAQNVSCTACTHEVSYFKGKGGLIAKADGTTEVTWVAQCGGVVRSGKLEANDDSIVSTLFDDDNNLACSTDDGRFRLGPVTDGGWFWITDDDNSAVGNLVNNDILGNTTTTLANAGEGVATAAGRGVTFVKETATGRVGILPNILPTRPVPPARKCGFTGTASPGAKTSSQARVATGCKLGDGKAIVRFHGPVGAGGATGILPNNTIVRPYSGGVDVFAALYMNGTGHFVTDPNGDPDLGWVGGTCLAGSRDDAMRCGGFNGLNLVVLPGIQGGFFQIRSRNPNAYGAKFLGLAVGAHHRKGGRRDLLRHPGSAQEQHDGGPGVHQVAHTGRQRTHHSSGGPHSGLPSSRKSGHGEVCSHERTQGHLPVVPGGASAQESGTHAGEPVPRGIGDGQCLEALTGDSA